MANHSIQKTLVCGILLGGFSILMGSCGGHDTSDSEDLDPIVAEAGDSVLLLDDVLARIPGGLSEADSTAMFEAVVKAWTERVLLREFAVENIDNLDRIERMVDDYRTRLIVDTYRMRLREQYSPKVSADRIRSHFESHKEDYILERPLLKGIYLKLPSNSGDIDKIRQWVFSGNSSDIDYLEREGLKEALQYSFFEDRWVDFQVISEQIPYRFYDANAFVESQRNFETSYDGITYLLHISESVNAGEQMPYEYAEPLIKQTLAATSAADYEKRLIRSIVERAEKEGRYRRHKPKQK